jgi:hypothetical protein
MTANPLPPRRLDIDIVQSDDRLAGHWNISVHVIDPDPAMAMSPYLLPNATPDDLNRELETWKSLHGKDGERLTAHLRNATPQIIAAFQGIL